MEKSLESRRRVKLYVLNAARHWDDRGTGHVSAMYSERMSGMALMVRDEQTSGMLLESKIDTDTSYQKQQETLIVWSENESDMALSFQEKAGCEDIWAKICQVQGKDPSVEVTQDSLEEEEDEEAGGYSGEGAGPGSSLNASGSGSLLPACEMGKLDKILEVVQALMSHPHQRDKLATAIEHEDYIKKLLEVFSKCEDLQYTEGLQQLFQIMKSILMLNRNALYEVLFSDECIEDVLGCLEWDPSATRPKAHRHYIRDIAKFKEVIPLDNSELLAKIQQMYRVQYIQDVILPSPSVFEDNILNTLQSFVFFNKMEIVNLLQDDEKFLKALFGQLCSSDTPVTQRRDAILFLKEFCQFSQTLQQVPREAFFRMLMAHGILQAIQGALEVPDSKTRAATVDVFTFIVELHPFVVREFCMAQAAKETVDRNLFFVHIIRQAVVNDPDPQASGAMQVLTIMKLLLDPENMLSSPNKTEKTEFLSFFYKRCIQHLFEPVRTLVGQGDLPLRGRESMRSVHIVNLILEFLSYCVEHHTYHIKNYIIGQDVLKAVLVLVQSAHQFLVVAVIRFVRKIIGLNDEFYNRYIEKGDHLKPILDVFLANGRRYNLLNSTVLELFDFIRNDDVKTLTRYVIGKYWDLLKPVTFTQTFNLLNIRFGMQSGPPSVERGVSMGPDRPMTPEVGPDTPGGSGGGMGRAKRFRRDDRDMEEEEESWFDRDEGGGSKEAEMESDGGGGTGGKVLPSVTAAPPVKRPAPDDIENDSPFSGPAWKCASRSPPSPRGRGARSPSPALKVSLSPADSTGRSLFNGPSHLSTPSTSGVTPGEPEPSKPSPVGKLSTVTPSSTKPASPLLVDYPDDPDEEEHMPQVEQHHNGTSTPPEPVASTTGTVASTVTPMESTAEVAS